MEHDFTKMMLSLALFYTAMHIILCIYNRQEMLLNTYLYRLLYIILYIFSIFHETTNAIDMAYTRHAALMVSILYYAVWLSDTVIVVEEGAW